MLVVSRCTELVTTCLLFQYECPKRVAAVTRDLGGGGVDSTVLLALWDRARILLGRQHDYGSTCAHARSPATNGFTLSGPPQPSNGQGTSSPL